MGVRLVMRFAPKAYNEEEEEELEGDSSHMGVQLVRGFCTGSIQDLIPVNILMVSLSDLSITVCPNSMRLWGTITTLISLGGWNRCNTRCVGPHRLVKGSPASLDRRPSRGTLASIKIFSCIYVYRYLSTTPREEKD
jgi:hypothetical protein